jgi:alpha-glucosidase
MRRFSYQRPSSFVLGLAGQSGELNRNGYRFELYNTDEFVHTPARRPLYQSWPLLFHRALDGEHWIAVLVDNPSRTFVDVGDFDPERVTFESVTGSQRVVLCVGETLQEVSHRMSLLFGGHPMPPAWALGYQQSRWSYMSSAEVRAVAARFREENLPCDALYFDIDYMNGARVFTHDQEHFPDLAECIAELKKDGFRSVCIVDPGVKKEEGNPLYDSLLKSAAVLKKSSGEPFIAKVWPGEVVLPDFGDAATREIWAQAQAEWLLKFQFDGIWNDMNEPSNFDGQNRTTSTTHISRGEFREESNLYGLWMAAASRVGWEKARPGERPLIISRSGYPGVQRYAVNWQGDNQAWWEHLRLAIDMSIAFSLSGAFYTGADVPGFTGNPPDDLAARFFQLGSWLPLFRGHSIFFAKDKEPFQYQGLPGEVIRSAIMLRYSLAREWYSGFERACRESRSLLFPVWTAEGSLVRDQFLCMDKFLVAPVVERDAEVRTVYLPEGNWFRLGYPHEEPVHGPRWQILPVSLKDCPVFVRAGSIVVRNRPGVNFENTLGGEEQFEVYRDATGAARGYWYRDDLVGTAPSQVRRELLIAEPGSLAVKRERYDERPS